MQQQLTDTQSDLEDLEQRVIDGCSPWACGGEVEPGQDDFGLAA
ncbi:hypothetical protein [Streptomyces yaanensis]